MCGCKLAKKLAKFHVNMLSLSENIVHVLGATFLTHTVYAVPAECIRSFILWQI